MDGTDNSEIAVFIFVCIYTAGSGSTHTHTHTHTHTKCTHPSVSTLDIFIRCRHNKFQGRKNKTHIPNVPSGRLFSLSCVFHSGIFLQYLRPPLFLFFSLNRALVRKNRSVVFGPVIIKHSSY